MYSDIYQEACQNLKYIEHIAGDIKQFRYPHLKTYENMFSFSNKLQTYMYQGEDNAIKRIAQEDITVYEFLSDKARKIHFSDMLGCSYDESDKEAAMEDLLEIYRNREIIFADSKVKTISFDDYVLKEGYEYIGELYHELRFEPIKILSLQKKTFPFGSVLKGTNIIISDENQANLGQDLVHMLFHLQEGIPGKENDNAYVKEIWAGVPQLYAHQLKHGRMARRTRMRKSPHMIHFQDYIFLRAYLGQCLSIDTEDVLSSVYGIIEPALQFIFYALKDKSLYDQNRILADAVLCDKTEELIQEFDSCFGEKSFSTIYGTYSIYDKYNLARQFMTKEQVEQIMFHEPTHIACKLPQDYIEAFWRKRLDENCIMLPTGIL